MNRKQNGFLMVRNKIVYEGAIYHIVHRAPGLEKLFVEEKDYLKMLSVLKETSKKYSLVVYSFVLMPNHVHLLLKISKCNLSAAMRDLFYRYAFYFNKKYERIGPVFSSPYRASLCLDDNYFLGTTLYIHLNPVSAGIVDTYNKYRWSSVLPYTSEFEKDTFIDYKFPLSVVDNDIVRARRKYNDLLNDGMIRKLNARFEDKKNYENFKKNIKGMLQRYGLFTLKGEDWKLEEEIDRLKNTKYDRAPETNKAKRQLILQLKARGYLLKEIADKLEVARGTVYSLLKDEKDES